MGKKTHGQIRIPGFKKADLAAIDELRLNPNNPNRHPEASVLAYAAVLKAQGIRQAVRVSRLSGLVVKGHGQVAAARVNGWTHVPVEYQDYDSPAQEFADLVADNALAQQADLDLAAVNAIVGDIGPGLELEALGIKGFTLDRSEKGGKQVAFTSGSKPACPRCGHSQGAA
jgi:hypothetical protein